MSGAQLDAAEFSGADLRRANLRGAGFRDARLDWADLRGARLGGAFLVRASLRGADLRGAYLRLARLDGADLSDANLEGVEGLSQGQIDRAHYNCSAANWIGTRIASPEMFPEAEMLPHLICSRPMFIGGAGDEADQHGGA